MSVGLLRLSATFAVFSLLAIGGVNAVVPEIQRQVVELNGWISSGEFAGLFALAQAAPGPNMLIVALIGWKLAGFMGALVCTLAICGPSSLLAYWAAKLWRRFHATRARRVIERGLAPITVGLVLASGGLLARSADGDWRTYTFTALTTVLMLRSRLNPLWLLTGAAIAGLCGVV